MGGLLGAKSGSPPKLMAVFVILSVCFLSTEAFLQLTNIAMKPSKPREGGTVRLTPNTLPPVPVSCRWYRGEMSENDTILIFFFYPHPTTRKEPSFTGKETMRPDCSLEIKNLKVTDSANYIVLIHGRGGIRTGSRDLVIPNLHNLQLLGRGLSKAAIAGAVLGSLGAVAILSVLLLIIYRSYHQEGRTLSSVLTCSSLEK